MTKRVATLTLIILLIIALLFIIYNAWVIWYEARAKKSLPTFPTGKYTCPQNGWANCMPILNEIGAKACSGEAIKWYKQNCPNFQGVAQ